MLFVEHLPVRPPRRLPGVVGLFFAALVVPAAGDPDDDRTTVAVHPRDGAGAVRDA
ncbi:MAG: hypothetical protein AB7G37_04125 [Solirubrobacteraceae bacterium]